MKKLNQLVSLLILAVAGYGATAQGTGDSLVQIVAEVHGLEPLAPAAWAPGTYWEALPNATFAPLPCPPFDPTLAVYAIAPNQYLADGTGGRLPRGDTVSAMEIESNAVVNLINWIQGLQATQGMRMTMDSPGIPFPGGGDGGGGGYGDFLTNSYSLSINTNLLWLQITNVLAGTTYANLSNATNQVYAIWSTPDLAIPFADWQVQTELFPTNSTTNCLPFTVSTLGGPELFLRAQDWTGVYANGLPCWWTWYNFHTLDFSWTDVDANGNTLGYDYTNHYDPNTIVFAIAVTNLDVSTANPSLPLNIISGIPGYAAILVNDTNLADAVWQPFSGSNVVAALGADGAYNVSVGLRGFLNSATQTWDAVPLIKNTVFPQLTVTNPVNSTLFQSPIQFGGLASEPLDTLTFDLSNAAGTFTNQQAYLTGVFYDPVLQTYTINDFQSDKVNLASGANTFTLHAKDWSGNQTNVSFTVNFVPSTNPPVLTAVWPQAGMTVLGTNVTLQAQVSDPMATVTATVNGMAKAVVVEADGSIWVQNVALMPGNNTVMLSANTALGGLTATNFAVTAVTTDLGIAIVTGYLNKEWNQNPIVIAGWINDTSTNSLTVNGQPPYITYGYNWAADNVPVNPYGMMTLNVQVSNPAFVASQTFNYPQPVAVVMKSYSGHQTFVWDPTTYGNGPAEYDNIDWFYNSGGTLNDPYFGALNITAVTNGNAYLLDFGWPFDVPWEYASLTVDVPGQLAPYESHTETRVMIEPGGITQVGTTNLYLVFATACEFSDTNINNGGIGFDYFTFFPYWPGNGINPGLPYGGDLGLPPEWLQINGKTLVDTGLTNTITFDGNPGPSINSSWGATVVSAAAGDTPDVTPVATRVYNNWDYTFDVKAYQINMKILDANGSDLTLQTNTVIVGQQMNLTCQISLTNSFFTNNFIVTNFQWTVPGLAISNYVIAPDTNYAVVVTNFPTTNATTQFYWVDGASNRVVQCSATVNGAIVTGQATFNIVKPSADWIGTVQDVVAVDENYVYEGLGATPVLHFGGSVDAEGHEHEGMVFTATNLDKSFDGTFSCAQIGNYSANHCQSETHSITGVGVGLDSSNPAKTFFDFAPGTTGTFQDSPAEPTSNSDIKVTRSDSFNTYLMYQPPQPSVPVPLKRISWSWSGSAIPNSSKAGYWTLISSNSIISANNQGSLNYPQWTNNIIHFFYTTNNFCQ